jgi:hypothetical protein
LFFVLAMFSPLAVANTVNCLSQQNATLYYCESFSYPNNTFNCSDASLQSVSARPTSSTYGTCEYTVPDYSTYAVWYYGTDGYNATVAASVKDSCLQSSGWSWIDGAGSPSFYNLFVTPSGNGSGVVTSGDGSISCGATCSSTYNPGDFVYLTASPNPSSTFTGWGGVCTGTGGCPVTMNESKGVTATFNLAPFIVVPSGIFDGVITDPYRNGYDNNYIQR